jgi:hypothetical protein
MEKISAIPCESLGACGRATTWADRAELDVAGRCRSYRSGRRESDSGSRSASPAAAGESVVHLAFPLTAEAPLIGR